MNIYISILTVFNQRMTFEYLVNVLFARRRHVIRFPDHVMVTLYLPRIVYSIERQKSEIVV